MKKIFLVLLVLSTSTHLFAQSEASFWYFGYNAGLRFNAQSSTVTAITDGQINTLEGCTSIADEDGNLLFYSDGRTVWNRNHQIMQNGDYFGGTRLFEDSSSKLSDKHTPFLLP
ncbi:hypothetical protein [Winogradskyella wichelsiae]|uniref:hypothetical protein n=1 Tax=Winogradskyella wichelsiae TaxID=2697007 RepID=UPI0015C85591|nr:hypothetical protein [Winogradskyella wichelsiae]